MSLLLFLHLILWLNCFQFVFSLMYFCKYNYRIPKNVCQAHWTASAFSHKDNSFKYADRPTTFLLQWETVGVFKKCIKLQNVFSGQLGDVMDFVQFISNVVGC